MPHFVPTLDGQMLRRIDIPMRDGVKLATTVSLPAGDGPFPVVLVRTAYNRLGCRNGGLTRAGLAVVSQDCRGRYDAQGEFYPFLNEGADGLDTLRWIRAQPWCNGKVGMYGDSYLAAVQFYLAPLAGEELTALNPRFMTGDPWKCAYYLDGALSLALTYSWLCFECNGRVSNAATMPDYDLPRLLRGLPVLTLDEQSGLDPVPSYRDMVQHFARDRFWKPMDVRATMDRFRCPLLLTGGWYDYYPAEALANWRALVNAAPTEQLARSHRVLIGPWTHGVNHASTLGQIDFGPQALRENDHTLRWLTTLLSGGKPEEMLPQPIRVFVMGENQWRDCDNWPPAGAQKCEWFLHASAPANSLLGGGALRRQPSASSAPDHYTYDPENPTPTLGGNHSVGPYNPGLYELALPGPLDQRPIERRDDVLVYTSAPLERDLLVIGDVTARLFISTTARDTDFVVRLCDVHPNGKSINLTEGVLRGRFHARQWERPELLEPGRVYELLITLHPTAHRFKAGHCLRVQVTSSNFPLWSRNHNTGNDPATDTQLLVARQTVLHDAQHPSRVTLWTLPV